MMFTAHYQSPLGEILLAADEVGLTGLWFDRAKYYAAGLAPQSTERETPPLTEAKRWLDVYFSGKMPDFMPPRVSASGRFTVTIQNGCDRSGVLGTAAAG